MTPIERTPEFYDWLFSRPSFPVTDRASQSMRDRAAQVWEVVKPKLGKKKLGPKRNIVARFAATGVAAHAVHGVVRYPRGGNGTPSISIIKQVADAMADAGFFVPYIAKPGSLMHSRLDPTDKLREFMADAPPEKQCCVELRGRKSKHAIEFDRFEAFPLRVHNMLSLVNEVNAAHVIAFRPRGGPREKFRPISPVHIAKFTDHWGNGGRIYAEHQNILGESRLDIRIDGRRTVELDFRSFHIRMLYHLRGLGVPGDLYALWGAETTAAQRPLVKKAVNIWINSKSEALAIESCVRACMLRHPGRGGRPKSGKDLIGAKELGEALAEWLLEDAARKGEPLWLGGADLSRRAIKPIWEEIFDKIRRYHNPVLDCFANDAGHTKLMPLDGKIALDVLHHFASKGIPCLGVHDSFIVPEEHEEELRRVMVSFYQYHVGTKFEPEIDKKKKTCDSTQQPQRKAA